MKQKMPLVSVVIPTYNQGKFICEAIDSVLAQTYREMEIIVVDDGSTDDTRKLLEKYNTAVSYIYQENRGPSSARNMGIIRSKGDYIAFLDSDDLWLPGKLEIQMEIITKHNRIGLVGCGIYDINADGEIIKKFVRKNYFDKQKLLKDLLIKNVIVGSCSAALVRKECFNRIGLFDESLRASEDWDVWLRIANLYDIQFIEQPLVALRIYGNNSTAPVNVKEIFAHELKFLNKLYSLYYPNTNTLVRRESYAYRYLCVAWAYDKINKKKDAAYFILKSFFIFPLKISVINNSSRIGLLLKILFGRRMFATINRLKRFIAWGSCAE